MASRAFGEVNVKPQVELVDERGQTVGVARNVPMIGRLFEYRHSSQAPPTRFRWSDRHYTRGIYAGGFRFWEHK